MKPSDLKAAYQDANPNGHFFDRKTMAVFGDRMSNYGVRAAKLRTYSDGVPVDVWELFRCRPVKHGLQSSAYFRKDNFKQTFGEPV